MPGKNFKLMPLRIVCDVCNIEFFELKRNFHKPEPFGNQLMDKNIFMKNIDMKFPNNYYSLKSILGSARRKQSKGTLLSIIFQACIAICDNIKLPKPVPSTNGHASCCCDKPKILKTDNNFTRQTFVKIVIFASVRKTK